MTCSRIFRAYLIKATYFQNISQSLKVCKFDVWQVTISYKKLNNKWWFLLGIFDWTPDSWFAVSRRQIRRADKILMSLSPSLPLPRSLSVVKYPRYWRQDWRGLTLPVVEGGLAVSVSAWGLSIGNRTVVLQTTFHSPPELQNYRILHEKVVEKIGHISHPVHFLYCVDIFQYSQGGFRFITNRYIRYIYRTFIFLSLMIWCNYLYWLFIRGLHF